MTILDRKFVEKGILSETYEYCFVFFFFYFLLFDEDFLQSIDNKLSLIIITTEKMYGYLP